MKRKVAFKTLGCRLNQFETDSLLTGFFKAGYEVVGFNEKADVYIINTCTVTNQGDHKSKTFINQAARNKNGSLVVVTGCMATSQKEYLENRGDLTYVVENPNKSQLLSLIESHFGGELLHLSDLKQDLFNFMIAEKSFHTRSMVKIQDGCNNFCTYCIVPSVRGRAVSRPVKDILQNIRQVVNLGYKEIVLTGVNISRYDYEGTSFALLVEKILFLPGEFRVRISSVEPEGLGDLFFDLFSHEKLCPHLHLCLQSGSDKILLKMKRTYLVPEYYAIIERIRKKHPYFNFTTDIMVGFPGETDEDFEESCRVICDIGFSHVHTFKYSARKGTRASSMPGQIMEKIKKHRSEVIRKMADENKWNYYSLFKGKEQTVLIEKIDNHSMAKGYGENYIPVEFQTLQVIKNCFTKVKIDSVQRKKRDLMLTANFVE
jgi:threonylcarbamoyladenosine tRNA methylthiotransferase MtaB